MEQLFANRAMWIGVLAGVLIGVGLSRLVWRDPWWLIGMKVVAALACTAGLKLARVVGDEAFLAATQTCAGTALAWATTSLHDRRRQSSSSVDPIRAGS